MDKKKCGECRYLELCKKENGMYWCEKKEKFMPANSEEAENCYGFWKRATYSDREAGEKAIKESEEYQENNKGYTSSGCYITTAVVNILGMGDDCALLKTLRGLRENHMQKDPQYRSLLMTYDVIGPVISRALWNDENRESIAYDILMFLMGATKLIAGNKIKAAIETYIDMTNGLIQKYVPSYTVGEEAAKNYDQQSGGHGAFVMTKRS